MAKFCAVISGVHGTREQVAVVHISWCGKILENVCEEMIGGNRAVIAALESDTKPSIAVEIRIVSGAKIPVIWHKCIPSLPTSPRYRINDGGSFVIGNGREERKIGCMYCGYMNNSMHMVCKGCGESLWQGFDERMYEYNRRLRDGIKGNDRRLVALSRQAIEIAIAARGENGWSIDDNGYAKKEKKQKVIVPEYQIGEE